MGLTVDDSGMSTPQEYRNTLPNIFAAKQVEGKMLIELKKKIRSLKKKKGSMPCPKHKKNLLYQWNKEADHFIIKCPAEDCYDIDEIGE